LTHIRYFNFYH